MLKFAMFTNIPMMPYFKQFFKQFFFIALLICTIAPKSFGQTTLNKNIDKTSVQKTSLQKGAALGLYSEDPNWSYGEMLDEMKLVGITHVAIVVPYYLKNDKASNIYKHPKFTVPMHTIIRTIKDARDRGFKIFLFPILRVEDQSNGGWRGTLAPTDINKFYKNYQNFIFKFAQLAQDLNIPFLSIGSELSTMDIHTDRWKKIILAVRQIYKGKLTYSANWDHYTKVKFFDSLDFIGVTGYFELSKKENAENEDPPIEQLIKSWREEYVRLMRFVHIVGKPLVFTEVGYLSQKGTAARPWNEGADEQLDLEIQRKCYEAFIRVWKDETRLAGNYFWNWFGWGGLTSKEYTPRNKPAANEIKKWYFSEYYKDNSAKNIDDAKKNK